MLRLQKTSNGLLWFNLSGISKRDKLVSAKIKLHIRKVYKQNGLILVYEAKPGVISSKTAPIKLGLASKYVNDQYIGTDEAVYFVEDFDARKNFYDILKKSWLTDGKHAASITGSALHRGYEPLLGESLTIEIKKGTQVGINKRFRFRERGYAEPERAYFSILFALGRKLGTRHWW